jgi:hypothetical protein
MATTLLRVSAQQFAFGCLLGVLLIFPNTAHADEHQLFVLVMNSYGQPIDDLREDEVVIEHRGNECDIKSVQSGTEPMKVALLVDNSDPAAQSINSLRDGLRGFLSTLQEQHSVGLFTISAQARQIQEFTTDRTALTEHVDNLFVERGTGTLLLDGLVETWKRRFDKDDSWPVFVLVVYDGAEASRSVQEREFNEFVNELRARAATAHAILISTRGGGLQTDVAINVTNNTGGTYRALAAATALPGALTELATAMGAHYEEVQNRYRVVFECDDDNPQRIQTRVTRPAVAVRVFNGRGTE